MNLSPLPVQKFFSNLGLPLFGGKLFTYVAGSTTKLGTFQDQAGTANSNPIILNFRGECNLWLDITKSYKFVLAPATDSDPPTNPIWTVDNVTAPVSLSDLTINLIGGILFPQTAAEATAGVTPINYGYRPYESSRYGVVGDGTNENTRLVNWLTAAQAASNGPVCAFASLYAPTGNIRSDSGLTFDYGKVFLNGNGNTLDFSTITSGAFSGVKLTASTEDLNLIGVRYGARGVQHLIILMPGYTTNANGVGMELVDPADDGAGNFRGARHRLDAVSILGGNKAFVMGAGAFGECITGLTIGHDAGHELNFGIWTPSDWSTNDGGEPPCFLGTFVYNSQTAVALTGGGGMKFIGGNFDGNLTICLQQGNGEVLFNSVYHEFTDGDNTQFKYRVEDANALLHLVSCEYVVRPDTLAVRTKSLINNTGTVVLRDLVFRGNNTAWYQANGGYIVEGAGQIYASGIKWISFPWAPLVSKQLQWLAYPDCNNANVFVGFTLTNGGAFNPVRVVGVTDGAGSTRDVVRFQINNGAAANSFSRAFISRAVDVGKRGTVCGQAFCNIMTGSNTVFRVTTVHKDVGGNALFTQTNTMMSTTQNNYTTFGGDLGTYLPGTVTNDITIELFANGVVNGNIVLNASPFTIGYSDGQ